jgi:polyisoprenyl-teichoic acid--peptidoglycan teichoic acid transferase
MGVPHVNIDRYRVTLVTLAFVLLAGCTFAVPLGSPGPSGPAGPTAAASRAPETTDAPSASPTAKPRRTATPRPTKAPTPVPTAEAEIPGLADLVGSDGRFTMLLLGVDARGDELGGRTDTIMFVTIDPNTGKVAMASLPRDMVFVPIGPGKTYGSGFNRINGLFSYLSATNGGKKKAFKKMVQAMEYMSGIEIDRYAMVGFKGVRNLVDQIGGVDVRLPQPLVDTYMHVRMKGGEGLRLKAGKNHLNGSVALAFARTRHTDTDYERGRRQQQLIVATLTKVLKRGLKGLPSLVGAMKTRVKTDVAFKDAPALLALADRADLKDFKSTILGPTKYAGEGDVRYSTKLKIDVVRAYFQKQFGPVKH